LPAKVQIIFDIALNNTLKEIKTAYFYGFFISFDYICKRNRAIYYC
jgi:hypothetical protein